MHRRSRDDGSGVDLAARAARLAAFVVAAIPLSALAANMGPVGGGAVALPRDEMAPARHAEIKATIEAKIQSLQRAGAIPEARAKALPGAPLAGGPAFPLQWPLRLVPGHPEPGARTVVNYVDHDPGYPGLVLDYDCGARTYDTAEGYNHQGTDITAYPFAWRKMANDEAIVVAAAPGIIVGKLDGQDDRSCFLNDQPWNAVYVRHADGSVAWYGHLKKGSLTSKNEGDSVEAGEFLGVMGSSGDSTGPHLHIELYDPDGNLVDPFAGACNNFNTTSWWAEQRPYDEPAIDLVMTGNAPVVFSPCPTPEVEHRSSYFQPGATVYLTAFFTDQLASDVAVFSVLAPDGTLYAATTIAPSAAYYAASYWESSVVLPSDAATGAWTFQVEFAGQAQSVTFQVGAVEPPRVDVVEYFAPSLDHYFMTGFANEEAVLDAGTPIAGWFRTGESFPAYTGPGIGMSTVCRFFGTPGLGVNSHFYTAFDFECAAVKQMPAWTFEANAFYIDADLSRCPASTRPVYRLYNNGMGGDPNHRYVTSWPIVNEMQLEDGWSLEGLVFCAPL